MSERERDRSSPEFVSEAQEIIEGFARLLLTLEAQQRTGSFEPDLLNAAFRAVHSLKGLAALFGANEIGTLSHSLESTLDALRLGKLDLNQQTMDVLFESVETFSRLLAASTDAAPQRIDLTPLMARIDALSLGRVQEHTEDILSWVGEGILGVLTEYEEHRLRENVRTGRKLYRIHATFDLFAIDVGIEQLKEKLKAHGEVITYLPSADAASDDRIELDILLGSMASGADVSASVADSGAIVFELSPTQSGKTSVTITAPQPRGPTASPTAEAQLGSPIQDNGPADVGDAVQGDVSLRSLSQTVRVDLHRLDHLMNLVGELGLVHANLTTVMDHLRGHSASSNIARELQNEIRTMARKLSLLQQGILDVRMVPLGQVFDKLARVVRKLGREAGKDIRLSISGAETELDKLIVEELSDPLMHMIRNCIDHGIEPPAERMEKGKHVAGRVDLRAFQKGNRVVLEVEDDGRGIDWREIRDKALERGLLTMQQAVEITPSEAVNLVFLPGFTTKERVDQLSGRGVGMDVVKTNISKLSGIIDVDTQPGRGTRFSVTLPVTLAIIQALVIQSAGQTFCVPLNSVLESIMVRRDEIMTIEGNEVISLRGHTLPLVYLSRLFGLEATKIRTRDARIYVVLVGLAQHRVGLVVDELLGQHDVVIKPLGKALRDVPGIAGATELGANRTVLLLDVANLVAESMQRSTEAVARGARLHGA